MIIFPVEGISFYSLDFLCPPQIINGRPLTRILSLRYCGVLEGKCMNFRKYSLLRIFILVPI